MVYEIIKLKKMNTKMHQYIILTLSIFLFIIDIGHLCGQSDDSKVIVNQDNIIKHTYFLGSDRLEGRGTGTEGENSAAEYISHLMHEYGLIPIGERISYFQNIPMHGSVPLPTSRFILYDGDTQNELTLDTDYQLYKSGAETFIPDPIPLVFAGYGIIAPEYDYNDYQSIDVQGKVVVFLSGEPYSEDPNFFNGKRPTEYSAPEIKQRIALSRGARGNIMIPVRGEKDWTNWEHWIKEFAFEHVTLAYTVSSHMSALLNPGIADLIFNDSEFLFSDIINMHEKGIISSFDLNTSVSFEGEFEERDFIARNIVASVPGTDSELQDTYLIVSAHYDHLGIGPAVKNDSIYNGVLDNALGVASLIEIARLFSDLDPAPLRTTVFMFLTGEEKGLLGSTYYTDHPIIPLHKTIANINIDGISAFDLFNDVIGIGSEYSTLEEDLIEVLDSLGLGFSKLPGEYFYESENINRSDHFAFMKAGIPSVLVTEGLHYKNTPYDQGVQRMINWNKNIYHSPFDDLNQPLNFDAVQQHAELIFEFAWFMANKTLAPEWKSGSTFINARLRTIAEKR